MSKNCALDLIGLPCLISLEQMDLKIRPAWYYLEGKSVWKLPRIGLSRVQKIGEMLVYLDVCCLNLPNYLLLEMCLQSLARSSMDRGGFLIMEGNIEIGIC